MILDGNDTGVSAPPVVATERLFWVGPITVLTSLAAVHVVRLIALTRADVAPASPMRVSLGWIAPTADTVILCSLAVLVFAMVGGFSDDPFRAFQRVALGALLVSFLPIVMMMHGNAGVMLTLGAMHLAAYIPCVTLMPALTRAKPGIIEAHA